MASGPGITLIRMNIPDLVHECAQIAPEKRQEWLQALIGPQVDIEEGRLVLHQRALLVTALNVAKLWPPRLKEDE